MPRVFQNHETLVACSSEPEAGGGCEKSDEGWLGAVALIVPSEEDATKSY